MGPWYGDGDGSPLSCRQLTSCVTEFGAQGLELDAVLLAWGADFRLVEAATGRTRSAAGYRCAISSFVTHINCDYQCLPRPAHSSARRGGGVRPTDAALDETHAYLVASGFMPLVTAEHH